MQTQKIPIGISIQDCKRQGGKIVRQKVFADLHGWPISLRRFCLPIAIAIIKPDDAVILDVVIVSHKDREQPDVDMRGNVGM